MGCVGVRLWGIHNGIWLGGGNVVYILWDIVRYTEPARSE